MQAASSASLSQALRAMASPAKAEVLKGFFKTGPGQYGEGDRFLGVTVPQIRSLLLQGRSLTLDALDPLLRSAWHEERVLGVFLVVKRAQRAQKARDLAGLAACHRYYLDRRGGINNWDLVDLSAEHVVGAWLWENPEERGLLKALAASKVMWDRRIAVLSTFHFIKRGDPKPTLQLCESLLKDEQDLMHKATGWMLREVGKRGGDQELRGFLKSYASTMPRTSLRYAIERFPETTRRFYLSQK